ncbi:MAG: glycosyltransferase [candidate division Zixibacteria bacterium]|nr:glycosyltransferase [candidate division Zixibacteria bacterium]
MIAVITHNYPSENNPVAGLFVQDHAELLRATRGVEVDILYYPSGVFPMTKAIRNPLKWPALASYFLGTGKKLIRDIEWLKNKNKGQRIEVIAHWWFPNGTFVAGKVDHLHVICHGTDLYQLVKFPFVARHYAEAAKKVDTWQCVSEDLKRILLKLYPFLDEGRISVEPMPIGPMFSDNKGERDPNLIVSVGALIERKMFDRLIAETAKVPDLKLEIYGRGPEQPKLEKLIADLGVKDRIKLAGQVTREELAEVYNRAHLFVLLSYDEGFGLVLKEAQACGCKTMAYKGDGMEDTGLDYPISRDEPVAPRIKDVLKELRG